MTLFLCAEFYAHPASRDPLCGTNLTSPGVQNIKLGSAPFKPTGNGTYTAELQLRHSVCLELATRFVSPFDDYHIITKVVDNGSAERKVYVGRDDCQSRKLACSLFGPIVANVTDRFIKSSYRIFG